MLIAPTTQCVAQESGFLLREYIEVVGLCCLTLLSRLNQSLRVKYLTCLEKKRPSFEYAITTEMKTLVDMGQKAKAAGRQLAILTTDEKNQALLAIADALEASADLVLEQNAIDIEQGRAKGLSEYLLDRLLLTQKRMTGLAADTRNVATLPDPVGSELESRLLPNGMRLSRRRTPIGVLGVIYEARPNVTIDIATLSLKTGQCRHSARWPRDD